MKTINFSLDKPQFSSIRRYIHSFNRTIVQEASFKSGEEHLVFDLLSLIRKTIEEKITVGIRILNGRQLLFAYWKLK